MLVHAAYTAQYADPIAFRAGERVEVGHADAEFPEWFWCRRPDAKEGWVHCSFLSSRRVESQVLRITRRKNSSLRLERPDAAFASLEDGHIFSSTTIDVGGSPRR